MYSNYQIIKTKTIVKLVCGQSQRLTALAPPETLLKAFRGGFPEQRRIPEQRISQKRAFTHERVCREQASW